MDYQDVENVKCLFCEKRVSGNQRFFLNGRNFQRGATPLWLKTKPEWRWIWNGLDATQFYICPEHADDDHYHRAFYWAEIQNLNKPTEVRP